MMLTVSGWRCPMTGPSARTSRTIRVSCTESGLCDETYTLTGRFTDDDTWPEAVTGEGGGRAGRPVGLLDPTGSVRR